MISSKQILSPDDAASSRSSRAVAYLLDGEFFKWTLSAVPKEVYLRSSVLNRISRDLASVGKRRQPGEELGGLLLGSRGGRLGQTVLRILSVDTYSSRLLHRVLASVKNRMAEQQKFSTKSSELSQQNTVLGYYRIAWEGRLGLSETDVALIREQFSEPESICLLIRDSQWTVPRAKFFFWRDKDLKSADLDFPALSQIAADAPQKLDTPAASTSRLVSRAVAFTLAAIVLAIVIGAFLTYEGVYIAISPKFVSPRRTSVLGLAATQQGKMVQLTWNRRDADILSAQSGVLSVSDGQQQKDIPLKAAQLGAASFWYFPSSDKVRFRLDITRRDGRRIGETVALILLKPRSQPPFSARAEVSGTLEDGRRGARAQQPPAFPAASAPPLSRQTRQPLRPQVQPPLLGANASSAVARNPVMPRPPETTPAPVSAPQGARGPGPPDQEEVVQAAPATAPTTARAGVPEPRQEHTVEAQPLVPARLKRLISHEIQLKVRLRIDATGKVLNAQAIGVEGKLALSLGKIAADTARRWKFKPTRQGGRAVPSTVVIQFKFTPGQ